jgi:hypothetical protein
MILNSLIIAGLLACSVQAAESFNGRDEMNGISFQQYKDFPKNWTLVTIRFRKDTGEMRLTYANESAMKALAAGSTDYPDGAVFAKTGVHTGVDPQFVSSVVPKGVRRYQFMVREKKAYASSGGWGYGLFDPSGKTFPEDPKQTQDACYACHTLVENRGQVFSQLFSFTTQAKFGESSGPLNEIASKISYEWIDVKRLPAKLRKLVPGNAKRVRSLKSEILRKHVFQGTLDELKPVLEFEVRQSASTALFLSADGKKFVMVSPVETSECMDLKGYQVQSTDMAGEVSTQRYCSHD